MQFFIATLLSTFYASSSAWTVPRLSSKGGCPFSLMRSTTADATSLGEGPKPEFLLDRIGGDVALEAAVDELYERLIVDESLAVYFDGVPMNKLKQHQFNFMRIAFTEIPEDLDVAGMLTEGHSRLWEMGLDENDFDAVAGHLVGTLEKLGLEKEQIDEVVGVVGPLRGIFEGKN